ncbi:MAG: hypothetical protein GTO40_22945 [Deltaproteobacteria bacterium]|nr:hypothetical protein [Deltaproteobacteria bacterium]
MKKVLLWIVLLGFVSACDVYVKPSRRAGLPPGHGGMPPGLAKKMESPEVYVEGRPNFIRLPGTNIRVMVGVTAYIFRVKGVYYSAYGNRWYMSQHYLGPWNAISASNLPPGLRGRSPRELKKQAIKRARKKYRRGKHRDY